MIIDVDRKHDQLVDEPDWMAVVRRQPLNNMRPEGQCDGDGQEDEDDDE